MSGHCLVKGKALTHHTITISDPTKLLQSHRRLMIPLFSQAE